MQKERSDLNLLLFGLPDVPRRSHVAAHVSLARSDGLIGFTHLLTHVSHAAGCLRPRADFSEGGLGLVRRFVTGLGWPETGNGQWALVRGQGQRGRYVPGYWWSFRAV